MSKKLARNSILYILLGFLTPAVNFILLPLYTKYLEPKDYALITLATLVQSILINFICPGQPGSISRFVFEHLHSKKRLHYLFSTAIINTLATGLVILIFMLLFGDIIFKFSFKNSIFTFKDYGIYIVLFAIVSNLQGIILAHYRNIENIKGYISTSLLFFLFTIIGIYVGVVVLEGKALGNILGRLIGLSIPLFIYLIVYYFNRPIVYLKSMDLSMLKYGLPLVPYSLTLFFYNNIDKFFLERFLSLETLGIFSFATSLAAIMEIFFNSVNSAINPTIFKLLLNENKIENLIKIRDINKVYIIISIIVILIVCAFAGFFIYFFIDNRYHAIILFIPILFLAYISRVKGMIYSLPLFFYKKTSILPYISLATLLVGVVFNWIFIPIYGIWAAIFSSFILNEVRFIFNLFACVRYKYLKKEYFKLLFENVVGYLIIILFLIVIFLTSSFQLLKFQISIFVVSCLSLIILFISYRKIILLQFSNFALFKKK